jgi:hypothetical protein
MKILPLLLLSAIFTGSLSTAFAQGPAEPGKSLWGIKLGSSRQQAIASVKKIQAKAKRQPSRAYAQGLTWDGWEISKGDQFSFFEMLSVKGKVTQLRTWTSEGAADKNSFAQLAKRHRLQKRVYLFADPEGGGYNSFYYDDVKKGICFTGGTQDMFILTSKPDGVLVHRPGVPAVAIESGTRGKTVTGSNARAFNNMAEAEKFQQMEIKKP